MEIIQFNPHHPEWAVLRYAGGVLRAGSTIVYPTDTAYALGGRYNSLSVIRRVLAIKGRRDRKFTLVASSLQQVERYFRLAPAERRLARQFWPGPLSIVVSSRYAVRVPASPVARALARAAGAPLIATSANRSGGRTPYSVAAVRRELEGRPPPNLILEGGILPKRKPSTIVRVDGEGKIHVIRAGAVAVER